MATQNTRSDSLSLVQAGSKGLQPAAGQQPGTTDANQVHQAVPVDLQRPQGKGNRVNLRISQHHNSLNEKAQAHAQQQQGKQTFEQARRQAVGQTRAQTGKKH